MSADKRRTIEKPTSSPIGMVAPIERELLEQRSYQIYEFLFRTNGRFDWIHL